MKSRNPFPILTRVWFYCPWYLADADRHWKAYSRAWTSLVQNGCKLEYVNWNHQHIICSRLPPKIYSSNGLFGTHFTKTKQTWFIEETLEGDNAYEAEGHGKQRAKKGIRFLRPAVGQYDGAFVDVKYFTGCTYWVPDIMFSDLFCS